MGFWGVILGILWTVSGIKMGIGFLIRRGIRGWDTGVVLCYFMYLFVLPLLHVSSFIGEFVFEWVWGRRSWCFRVFSFFFRGKETD